MVDVITQNPIKSCSALQPPPALCRGGDREGHLLSGHSVVEDQETKVRLPEMQGLWDRTTRDFSEPPQFPS